MKDYASFLNVSVPISLVIIVLSIIIIIRKKALIAYIIPTIISFFMLVILIVISAASLLTEKEIVPYFWFVSLYLASLGSFTFLMGMEVARRKKERILIKFISENFLEQMENFNDKKS